MTRVAVVTGGAGAIGASIVSALGQSGHTALTLDQAGDPPVDLSDEHQVRAAARRVLDQHGRCDVLVHAAAAFDRADLAAVDLVTWRRVQAVNVESALLLAQAFVPGHGGPRVRPDHLRGVGHRSGPRRAGDMLPYVTSKGALVALARTLAVGHGADGIAVTCVAPGLTATPAARQGLPPAAFEDVRVGACALLTLLFAWWLRRAPEPFLPLAVLANPVMRLGTLATSCALGVMTGFMIYLPLYYQVVHKLGHH